MLSFEFIYLNGGIMKPQPTRSPQDVRADWFRKGVSLNAWARCHGFSPATVSQVLNGKNNCAFGAGHRIAVTLGIKDGEILEEFDHDKAA